MAEEKKEKVTLIRILDKNPMAVLAKDTLENLGAEVRLAVVVILGKDQQVKINWAGGDQLEVLGLLGMAQQILGQTEGRDLADDQPGGS